ncbi:hypothetical protein GCM10009682_06160 [Luedemannella flava]|uniref:Uncharacterized protein n=1 Tax=Luedemannella flava TaxID=349316 RepID=A0ABP4XKR0_9ACTN
MSGDVKHDWDVPPPDHLNDARLPVANIDINLDDVGGFGKALHNELERNLRPNAAAIARECEDDAINFGVRMTTPAIRDMRVRYQDSLAQTLQNVRNFVMASQVLIAAAEKIVSEYGAADGMSGDTANKILSDALGHPGALPNSDNAEAALSFVTDVPTHFGPRTDAP